MRVVYILDIFPKISETFILNEILEMQKKGIDIEVCAFLDSREEMTHRQVRDIEKVTYLPVIPFHKKVYAHLYWCIRNPFRYCMTAWSALNYKSNIIRLFLHNLYHATLITKGDPAHLHAHFGSTASNMAMLIHLLTGIPFSFTTHRYDIFDTPPRNYRLKSALAKKHITVSDYNKNYIVRNFGVDAKNITVIHCGIDFDTSLPFAGDSEDNIILSIARLEKFKGIDNLIKACAKLKKENIQFTCLIIGEGSQRKDLEKMIDEYGISDMVKLLGSKTRDEVFEFLSRAKVKVLPSRSEGLPVVLMEAMALRVPVVASNITGIPELVEDGVSGFLVPPDDVEALVEKIKILLTDKGTRQLFAENGYNRVFKDFNLKLETDKLLEIWKS